MVACPLALNPIKDKPILPSVSFPEAQALASSSRTMK
jgi:hypothetical protein